MSFEATRIIYYYINPKDPAVTPTATKKPNSNNPCAEAGVDINILLKNVLADIEIKVCCD
tara:strand:+ start:684 stop:863 length:180 start_codon:yes stop_codon:yes gene_type:complete